MAPALMLLRAPPSSSCGSSALRGSPNGGFLSLHPAPAVLVALSRRSSDCRAVIGSVLDAPRDNESAVIWLPPALFASGRAGSADDRLLSRQS
jgi:hypothetical protein